MTEAGTLEEIKKQVSEIQIALVRLASRNDHIDFIMSERKSAVDEVDKELRKMSEKLNKHVSETHSMLGAIHAKINFAAGAVAVIAAAATFIFNVISAKIKGV